MFATAMMARTAKKVFLSEISNEILQKKERNPKSQNNQNEINEHIADFLNLFLGSTDQTQQFYNNVLYPRTRDYFGVSTDDM